MREEESKCHAKGRRQGKDGGKGRVKGKAE